MLAGRLHLEIDIFDGVVERMRFDGRADHNFSNGWTGPESEVELERYEDFEGIKEPVSPLADVESSAA